MEGKAWASTKEKGKFLFGSDLETLFFDRLEKSESHYES